MTFAQKIIRLLAFITTVMLALLYFNQRSTWYAILAVVLCIAWYRLGDMHIAVSNMGFFSVSILTALDVIEHGISVWAIILMHAAVAEWDLLSYISRLQSSEIKSVLETTILSHLYRLGYVISIGLALSLLTLYLRTNLSLVGIIICGLVVMIALSRTIIRLRRGTA